MDAVLHQWFFWRNLANNVSALDLYTMSLTSASTKQFFHEHVLNMCQFDVGDIARYKAWNLLDMITPQQVIAPPNSCHIEYNSTGCIQTTLADWAARKGYLPLLLWLVDTAEIPCTSYAIDWAARNGHMIVVEWLHKRGIACTDAAADWAAMKGHTHVLDWLYTYTNARCSQLAPMVCAGRGDISTLKWLHSQSIATFTDAAMDWACACDHHHVVDWLESVVGLKRSGGNLECVRKLAFASLEPDLLWD